MLLDLNLLKRDGREGLAELKRSEVLRAILVGVLTELRGTGDLERSWALQLDGYADGPKGPRDHRNVLLGF